MLLCPPASQSASHSRMLADGLVGLSGHFVHNRLLGLLGIHAPTCLLCRWIGTPSDMHWFSFLGICYGSLCCYLFNRVVLNNVISMCSFRLVCPICTFGLKTLNMDQMTYFFCIAGFAYCCAGVESTRAHMVSLSLSLSLWP